MPLQKQTATVSQKITWNPCAMELPKFHATLSWLAEGTDCRCCLGLRIILAGILGVVIGVLVS